MKSPVSTCGVYSGLRLPRRVSAICVARRPRVLPSASTTYQSRWRLAGVATKVFIAQKPRGLPTRPGDDSHLAVWMVAYTAARQQPNPVQATVRERRNRRDLAGLRGESDENRP